MLGSLPVEEAQAKPLSVEIITKATRILKIPVALYKLNQKPLPRGLAKEYESCRREAR